MKTIGLNPHDHLIAIELKHALMARVPLHSMMVFGSRARGDHDPDSDMDVLVILDDTATASDRRAVSDCAWDISIQLGVLITPVVYVRRNWETGPERSSLLALAVAEEGVAI